MKGFLSNFQGMFSPKTMRGDIFGGITAGIVAIPLALAFGVQSGMGAIYGLYGAFAIGVIAAIFGGTATQISGPTGPMTVVTAQVIALAVAEFAIPEGGSILSNPAALGMVIAVFLLGGVLQIFMGVLKIGGAVRYIPYPVLSGFMSGIGVIIILLQWYPFFGLKSPRSTFDVVLTAYEPLMNMNVSALLLGLATIAIIYGFPRITKIVPSALVALVVVTAAASFMKLDVPVIGDVPEGIPELLVSNIFNFPMGKIGIVIGYGAMLALLGAIDSLLTSVVADNITKTRHDSNQELIGQGFGNIGSAIIGGIPGAGATMRTVVNVNAGGRTRLSGAIHGLLLFVLLIGAGPLAAQIPLSVLAGILITVGIGIIDYKGIGHLSRIPRSDAGILAVVLTLTVFWNLLYAVFIGVILAAVLFMKRASDLADLHTKAEKLKEFEEDLPWSDETKLIEQFHDEVYIKHFYGPLFFGYAFSFKDVVAAMPKTTKIVIMRMERVPYIDQSGAYVLEEALLDFADRNVKVVFSGLTEDAHQRLESMGIIPRMIPENHIYANFESCANWLKKELLAKTNGKELKSKTRSKAKAKSKAKTVDTAGLKMA